MFLLGSEAWAPIVKARRVNSEASLPCRRSRSALAACPLALQVGTARLESCLIVAVGLTALRPVPLRIITREGTTGPAGGRNDALTTLAPGQDGCSGECPSAGGESAQRPLSARGPKDRQGMFD